MTCYDLVVIGGGINGCGIAADAALRGLSVLLCEKDTLAAQTSSKSSKLIHGGLRYLESYDFALVKKARDEQQRLLTLAPHLVRPCPFILPHQPAIRSFWRLRAGLFLYDHLSLTNTLPPHRALQRSTEPRYFEPLQASFTKGLLYYDCLTDDVALTQANAQQALQHGARILTHTPLIAAQVVDHQWQLTFQPQDHPALQVQTKVVVNASGPFLKTVATCLHTPLTHTLALVKGSHLLMPPLYEGEQAYVLQHRDKRIIFVLPYQGKHLIGTTDTWYNGDLNHVTLDVQESEYLCHTVNQYFKQPLSPTDQLDSFSGVRPLVYQSGQSAQALSRDYVIDFTSAPAPCLTIYGGKITTYRQLALEAVNALKPLFPDLSPSRTQEIPLP